MLNLDTHILVYALQGTLKPAERRLLAQNPWSISAIVLWELTKLVQLKRISVDLNSVDFAMILSRIHIWPLSLKVCQEILRLDFRSDPADEIIAGTSIVYNTPLLTRDSVILKSKLVPFAK
jgi:PIN domain nuclease of toxin-antitoxin system